VKTDEPLLNLAQRITRLEVLVAVILVAQIPQIAIMV